MTPPVVVTVAEPEEGPVWSMVSRAVTLYVYVVPLVRPESA